MYVHFDFAFRRLYVMLRIDLDRNGDWWFLQFWRSDDGGGLHFSLNALHIFYVIAGRDALDD